MSINDDDIIELFIEVEKLDKRFARRLSNRTQHCEGQHRCILILEMMGSMNQRKLADALHISDEEKRQFYSTLKKIKENYLEMEAEENE